VAYFKNDLADGACLFIFGLAARKLIKNTLTHSLSGVLKVMDIPSSIF